MADHYGVLGVTREATQDEIKRAYRSLARELHPDTNPDPAASERFKEITHAYEVLSDPQKRERYDMFGDDRMGAAGFGDFHGISDLFSTFFGGAGGSGRRGPARGADLLAEVEITLEEAAEGAEREVEVTALTECETCAGSGSAPGTFPVSCTECGGTGEIRTVRQTMLGQMITATTCGRCGGSGQEIVDPCKTCRGAGRVERTEALTVQIPPGVDDGAQLRVSGRGQAGTRGGRAGDLYVGIRVLPHDTFQRAGADLGCEVPVPMTVAALGGVVTVPTLEGPEELDVTPGTQSGEVVRLPGRGMPRIRARGRGELVVLLKVETPSDLSEEEAELLRRFAELRNESIGGKGFFDRIKEAFN
ncbi:MAG: molecular chaperone DnaJ [Actinomycetota bacterium]|nr:molecular chaperone DnaJ [Actinomycetota bacterium]